MNFDEFKDETISLIMKDKLKGKVLSGTPIYSLSKDSSDEVHAGGLDIYRSDLIEYIDSIKRITESQGYTYASLSVFSMIGDLESIKDNKEEKERIEKLNPQELMKYLEDNNLLLKSITIRFENKLDSDDNCIISFMLLDDNTIKDHMEVRDNELDGKQIKNTPFSKGFFNESLED